jgi:hypothetical protein
MTNHGWSSLEAEHNALDYRTFSVHLHNHWCALTFMLGQVPKFIRRILSSSRNPHIHEYRLGGRPGIRKDDAGAKSRAERTGYRVHPKLPASCRFRMKICARWGEVRTSLVRRPERASDLHRFCCRMPATETITLSGCWIHSQIVA